MNSRPQCDRGEPPTLVSADVADGQSRDREGALTAKSEWFRFLTGAILNRAFAQPLTRVRRSSLAVAFRMAIVGFTVPIIGCSRDARLADAKLRHPVVQSVSHYGMTLDETATPKQVAFVLLRAIYEDFHAATKADREAALDKQFDLCAANAIAQRNPTSMSRDEFLYSVVYRWTPAVAHYVESFPKTWEQADSRFLMALGKEGADGRGPTKTRVYVELADPSGDANAQVVLIISLAKDKGFWRVLQLGYDYTRRALPTRESVASKSDAEAANTP